MLLLNREIQAFYLNKLLILGIFLTTGLGLSGCQQLIQTPVAIAKIAQKQIGAKVYLQGKVLKQAPFLGSGAYQLQDATGSVWIVTNHSLPQPGEQILIQGEIQADKIFIAQQVLSEIYIVELKQVEKL
jgi:cytochrome c-type biogenesis protein CcmE